MLLLLLSMTDEVYHPKILDIQIKYHGEMMIMAKSILIERRVPNYNTYAEDAVQNAFFKIIKHIKKIDAEVPKEKLKSYVLSIVVNEVYDIISDIKYHRYINESVYIDDESNGVEDIYNNASYNEIKEKVARLGEIYSSVLMYHFGYDMSVKEIAKKMRLSKKTVYTRLERGIQKLRESMGVKK